MFGHELLAAYLATKQFQHFLEEWSFFIATDHKPLTYALNFSSQSTSPCEIRHLPLISEFTAGVRYVKGTLNAAADVLSRMSLSALMTDSDIFSYQSLAAAQQVHQELAALPLTPYSVSQDVAFPDHTVTPVCDICTGEPQLFVPRQLRFPALKSLRFLSHSGIKVMQKLVSHFVWLKLARDACAWSRACLVCQ